MTLSLLKFATVAACSGLLMACSSAPKAPVETTNYTPLEITQTERGPMVSLDDVLFDFEEATLRPEAAPVISQAAAYLQQNPERNALVEGHADATGDARFNQILSVERSRAVKDALIAAGIPTHRIQSTGLGETKPVADNKTRDGRQANRRVEIFFQNPSI